MSYTSLKGHMCRHAEYTILPLRHEDMQQIRIWRNEQMDVLRQKKAISKLEQEQYYLTHIKPTFNAEHPQQLLFSFLHENMLIGYGGLVNIAWLDYRAEMSFLVSSKRRQDLSQYKKDMNSFIQIMKAVCFDALDFNKLFTETFEFRTEHIKILEAEGFFKEGVMREHVYEDGKFASAILHSVLKKEYYES